MFCANLPFVGFQVVRNIEFFCQFNCVICLVSCTPKLIPYSRVIGVRFVHQRNQRPYSCLVPSLFLSMKICTQTTLRLIYLLPMVNWTSSPVLRVSSEEGAALYSIFKKMIKRNFRLKFEIICDSLLVLRMTGRLTTEHCTHF